MVHKKILGGYGYWKGVSAPTSPFCNPQLVPYKKKPDPEKGIVERWFGKLQCTKLLEHFEAISQSNFQNLVIILE